MPLLYRIYKNNNSTSKGYNKYYARASYTGTVDTDALAEQVSYSTTATKADCKAVIEGLIKAMTEALQSSQKVKLDGLGIFKIGISTTPADTAEDFSATKNISGVRVNFQPCWKGDSATGTRTTTFKTGIKIQEAAHNEF